MPACLAVTAAALLLTAFVGIRWGAFAVGGSDSHCYAGQARMLAEGRVSLAPPLVPPVPWPNAGATFAPSGFAPGPGPDGGSVPLCPAGLAVAMAAAVRIAGDAAIFAVVPLMGLLAVWCTWLLGRRLAGPGVGAASALLLACSPIFLYQLVQPMSDVPAAALWTAALATALGAEPRARATAARGLARGPAHGCRHHDAAEPGAACRHPAAAGVAVSIGRPRGGRRRWRRASRRWRSCRRPSTARRCDPATGT